MIMINYIHVYLHTIYTFLPYSYHICTPQYNPHVVFGKITSGDLPSMVSTIKPKKNLECPPAAFHGPSLAKAHQKELFKNHSMKLVDVDWDTPPKMKGYKEHLPEKKCRSNSHGMNTFGDCCFF